MALAYSAKLSSEDQAVTTRKDQTYLERLKGGHHPDLRYYANRLNPSIPANCPRCGFESETAPHWIMCPGTLAARHKHFGTVEMDLDILSSHPRSSLALARSTLCSVEKDGSQKAREPNG